MLFALLLEMGRGMAESRLTPGYLVLQGLIVMGAGYFMIAGLRALNRGRDQ